LGERNLKRCLGKSRVKSEAPPAEELYHGMEIMEVGRGWRSTMGKFYRIGVVIVLFISLFILLILLAAPGFGIETKTAYTRDGIQYISKERVDENIRYEYAKPGDYREVQVPLNTIVVGASTIPEKISMQQEKKVPVIEENSPPKSNQTASASSSENKYPHAYLFIGLLVIGGLVFFVASVFSGRDRQ
jgi:hypothetical protein